MNNDRIILSVYIPVEDRNLEVKVYRGMKIFQVADMIAEMIKRSESEFIPSGNNLLCDKESGKVLDPGTFIDDLGLHNGSELILM